MKNYFRILIAAAVLVTLLADASSGQQSGWRGPGRTGIYNEKGLMKSWPATGPSLLWEVTGIGKGYSSATAKNLL